MITKIFSPDWENIKIEEKEIDPSLIKRAKWIFDFLGWKDHV